MKRIIAALVVTAAPLAGTAEAYNPLSIQPDKIQTLDLTVEDAGRDREIPTLVYLPATTNTAPIVLFSHGLGGSRLGSAYLGKHWAARGYVAVFIQHPGSDDSVWKDISRHERKTALQAAASGKNYMLRVKDVPAVIDQLEQWNGQKDHPLFGRMDCRKIGMSGHSFGAVTTQAVSGQTAANGRITFTDPRIKAACAFSPSSPRQGRPDEVFAKVRIPWMLMTGTRDLSIIGNTDMESRLAVFPALPKGGKYELVLHNAEHSAFTERPLPGDTEPRNSNHHRAILAHSTAFWDAYLGENAAAQSWLDGTGAKTVLEKQDRWQRK